MPNDLFPIGDATASDIRDLKQPGLLLPIKKNDQSLLVFDWDGKMHAVMLSGGHPFGYFQIKLDTSRTGLFIPDVEILIDFSSATNGAGLEEVMGVLFLEQNQLALIAKRIGDQFDDPHPVPLWQDVKGGSDAAKVAFTHWGIGVREGDGFRALWEWKKLAKETE